MFTLEQGREGGFGSPGMALLLILKDLIDGNATKVVVTRSDDLVNITLSDPARACAVAVQQRRQVVPDQELSEVGLIRR